MNTLLWSLFFCYGENEPDIQTAPPPTDQGGLPKLISCFFFKYTWAACEYFNDSVYSARNWFALWFVKGLAFFLSQKW